MAWWSRRRGPGKPADHDPAESDPRVPDDVVFVDLVRSELDRLGCRITSLDSHEAVVSGRIHGRFGLRDIQQTCAPLPRGAWRGVISEHLGGLARGQERHLDLRDLTSIRPLLRTRLYDESGVERSAFAGRILAPGLFEGLVVDQTETVHGVPTAIAERWPEDLDDLLTLARGQVLDDGLLQREELDLGATSATLLEGGSAYTTAHLHWLTSYVDVPVTGALVIVPTRSVILAHPMRAREATLAAAQTLLVNAARLYDDGPWSVSPHLYWWRPGELVLLPGTADEERVELRPPPEFVDVLDRLP